MKIFLIMAILLFAPLANAQDNITIVADDKVEWHNKEGKMVAIGNAEASNSSMSIKANKLEGVYVDVNGKRQISDVFAYDDVILTSQKAKGYGSKLIYDVKKDEAILFGNPAIIKTDKETLKAREELYYYPNAKYALAKGGVEAQTKDGNKLFADEMKAYFFESNNSSMELEKIDIWGNIKIVTKDAIVYADKGNYFPQSGEVHLFENVRIEQGENILRGDKAIANLNTGVSKLIAGSKGQVKGKFKAKE